MGNVFKSCKGWREQNKTKNDIVILLAGLDNAGKTRTAGILSGSNIDSEAPTVGFQPARLHYRRRIVHLHDVGGSHQFRRAWRHYYPDAHGLIFVVDSADRTRLQESAQVLEEILAHPCISGKPVLILANKQDLAGAMDDLDIVENLKIESIVNRYKCPTRVESYTASVPKGKKIKPPLDPGLKKGYEWLLNYIIHRYEEINARVLNDVKVQLDNEAKLQNNDDSTGFENPNYKIDLISKDSQNEEGIIVVQQAKSNCNLEVEDDKVNLSPLFGTKNKTELTEFKTIELEARKHMRKLSPINRSNMFMKSISTSEDKNDDINLQGNANKIFARQLKEFKSQENLNDSLEVKSITDENVDNNLNGNKSRTVEVSLSNTKESPKIVTNVEGNKKILPPIKFEHSKKDNDLNPIKNLTNDNRPKSASGSVRMQLENADNQKRKLSFKGLRRNKTNPEDDTSLYVFDPKEDTIRSPQKEAIKNNKENSINVQDEIF